MVESRESVGFFPSPWAGNLSTVAGWAVAEALEAQTPKEPVAEQ